MDTKRLGGGSDTFNGRRPVPAHSPQLPGKTKDPCRPACWRTGVPIAEGKRFELLVRGYRTLVFKTSSFGRSDNLPRLVVFHRHLPATKQRPEAVRCTLV